MGSRELRLMDRRALLCGMTLGTISLPLGANAQRGAKVYRIGVLSPVHVQAYMTPFVEGLRELGWVEGRDFMLEYRFSGDTPEGADTAARELAALKVDVIVTLVTGNAVAAKRATAETPIVMMNSGYPVEVGLAKSYGRPGGNVTGNTAYAGTEVFGKHVEILKTLLPRMRRLAVLWGYVPPFVHPREGELALDELKRAANTLGVTMRVLKTRRMEDVESALRAVSAEHTDTDALYVSGGSVHFQAAPRIVEFARERRLPTMTDVRPVFQAGMLLTYSPSPAVLARQAAGFLDRILQGARPSELPIERPSKVDLIINLKTAKDLGLTIPPSLLLRADQVIE
jgi:putative ABC transport system substrate-binding protein